MAQALAHHRLHVRTRLHANEHPGLVDVSPLPHHAAGAQADGMDVTVQIRRSECQLLHAAGHHGDTKHGHVATVTQKIGHQRRKR